MHLVGSKPSLLPTGEAAAGSSLAGVALPGIPPATPAAAGVAADFASFLPQSGGGKPQPGAAGGLTLGQGGTPSGSGQGAAGRSGAAILPAAAEPETAPLAAESDSNLMPLPTTAEPPLAEPAGVATPRSNLVTPKAQGGAQSPTPAVPKDTDTFTGMAAPAADAADDPTLPRVAPEPTQTLMESTPARANRPTVAGVADPGGRPQRGRLQPNPQRSSSDATIASVSSSASVSDPAPTRAKPAEARRSAPDLTGQGTTPTPAAPPPPPLAMPTVPLSPQASSAALPVPPVAPPSDSAVDAAPFASIDPSAPLSVPAPPSAPSIPARRAAAISAAYGTGYSSYGAPTSDRSVAVAGSAAPAALSPEAAQSQAQPPVPSLPPAGDDGSVADSAASSLPLPSLPPFSRGRTSSAAPARVANLGAGPASRGRESRTATPDAPVPVPADPNPSLPAASVAVANPGTALPSASADIPRYGGRIPFPDRSAYRPENFAVSSGQAASSSAGAESGDLKNSLVSEKQQDTKVSAVVGTTSAHSTSMASATSSHRSAELALATAGSSARISAEVAGQDRSPATSTARDAVDTVMRLADAQASRSDAGSRSVSLGFKFGDEHLSVRVEMRGNEVHTQFVTHSAELRDALASQWSAMTSAGAGGRNHLDFAQPQFSSPSTTDPRSQGGGSGHARDGREQSGSFGSRLGSGAAGRSSAPAASASASNLSSAPAPIAAGVQHLNVLA